MPSSWHSLHACHAWKRLDKGHANCSLLAFSAPPLQPHAIDNNIRQHQCTTLSKNSQHQQSAAVSSSSLQQWSACLCSFIYNCDIKSEVPQLEGGNPRQGGTHHAGMLQHFFYCLLLALLLLFGEAAQL